MIAGGDIAAPIDDDHPELVVPSNTVVQVPVSTLRSSNLRMKIPRFRGHPNWRENAPGVIHGQAKEAA